MKNIIYGLGTDFWRELEYNSEIFANTIALCDADESKKELESLFDRPVITPDCLPETIALAGGSATVYIATNTFYNEIFEILTTKMMISPEYIAGFPAHPRSDDLISIKQKYYSGVPEPINAEALKSAILLPDRATALKYMPKDAVVAEIGVAYGDFSKEILDVLSPKKFYAIDHFSQSNPFGQYFGRDDFIRDNMAHRQWYEHRFKDEIKRQILETRQGCSWECLKEFPDESFDYAYLDAAHDYTSVSRDLDVLKKKMRNGGYIQFNDYCNGPVLASYAYGVIAAVNSFVNAGIHSVKYFCLSHGGHFDIIVQIRN